MIRKERGFTLIELLVVIAIIGILAAIVLSSLNIARGKSTDAKTKGQLSGLRVAAENFFDSNNNYGVGVADSCSDDFFVDTAADMDKYTDPLNYPGGATLSCHSDGTAYAVSGLLLEAGVGEAWCVDSKGSSKLIPANLDDGDVACP